MHEVDLRATRRRLEGERHDGLARRTVEAHRLPREDEALVRADLAERASYVIILVDDVGILPADLEVVVAAVDVDAAEVEEVLVGAERVHGVDRGREGF